MMLSLEEFKNTYYRVSLADELHTEFKELHGLDLAEEVDKIIKAEYDLYVSHPDTYGVM